MRPLVLAVMVPVLSILPLVAAADNISFSPETSERIFRAMEGVEAEERTAGSEVVHAKEGEDVRCEARWPVGKSDAVKYSCEPTRSLVVVPDEEGALSLTVGRVVLEGRLDRQAGLLRDKEAERTVIILEKDSVGLPEDIGDAVLVIDEKTAGDLFDPLMDKRVRAVGTYVYWGPLTSHVKISSISAIE